MKEFKRKLCLLLTLVMILSTWTMPVLADVGISYGSITIKNAEVGRKYVIYKIFDISESDDESIAYTTKLTSVATAISGDTSATNPFKITAEHDRVYSIEIKDDYKDNAEAVRTWLNGKLAAIKNGMTENTDYWEKTGDTTGAVVFDNKPYGFYLMTTIRGDAQESVTTTANLYKKNGVNAIEIIDKNTNVPSGLSKKVDSSKRDVAIGEEIDYSFEFLARNYYSDNGSAKKISSYALTDVANGLRLKDKSSIEIRWYPEDGSGDGTVINVPVASISNTYNGGVNTLTIPLTWQDDDGSFIYQSPILIRVKYKMIVDEKMMEKAGDNNYGKNTVTVRYYYEGGESNLIEGSTPSQTVYTSGLSIGKRKDDIQSEGLEGAYFILYKEENSTTKYYKWATASDGVSHYPDWVADKSQATIVKADNRYETVEFKGLTAGDYFLKEIIAPEGFSVPEGAFPITISFDESKTENKYTGTSSSDLVTMQNQTDKQKNYVTALVINKTNKTALPTTGGAGTILLIAGGSILFLAAGLILVTKKRMYNEEA